MTNEEKYRQAQKINSLEQYFDLPDLTESEESFLEECIDVAWQIFCSKCNECQTEDEMANCGWAI